jgi:hypothetical protein
MAVHCQDLTLGAFSSCSALFVLVVALFKKFSLFLYTPRMSFQYKQVQNLLSINKPSLFGKELSQSYKLNAFLMPFFSWPLLFKPFTTYKLPRKSKFHALSILQFKYFFFHTTCLCHLPRTLIPSIKIKRGTNITNL